MNITIDAEFKSLIPPLTADEFDGLKESILRDGCRDALVLWGDTLIDGHNRYEICTANGIPFQTVQMEFADRQSAIVWIIKNQFGRRNLPAYDRARLALRLKNVIAEKAKENLVTHTESGYQGCQKSDKAAIDTKRELASIAGVSHDTIHKVEKIEAQATPEIRRQVQTGEISINQAYKAVKREEMRTAREEHIEEQIGQASRSIDIFNADRKYRVIYADPPWQYSDKQNIETLGGAEKHYPTMPLDDICALPVPSEDNAVLFLWVTSPMLEDSFRVIRSWGFRYKASFVWDKVAHNMGHYNSVRHEFLLIATKGSCTPDVQRLFDSVQSIERERHSAKPDAFRKIIDTLYTHGAKLEMFARRAADGWDAWGNMV